MRYRITLDIVKHLTVLDRVSIDTSVSDSGGSKTFRMKHGVVIQDGSFLPKERGCIPPTLQEWFLFSTNKKVGCNPISHNLISISVSLVSSICTFDCFCNYALASM